MSFQEYIFCPLCGEHKWETDKTAASDHFTCMDCKNFQYSMRMTEITSENGLNIFYRDLDTEQVTLPPYKVFIQHMDPVKFTITDEQGWTVLLETKAAPKFNWYDKTEELVARIKKFLVFS